MTAKCAYCGGSLKFDADIQMLVCEHCSGMFPVEKTEEEKMLSDSPQDMVTDINFQNGSDAEEMECSVYHCTSCGAQLALNDVEAATYCAYCGQPTIVFDRIVKRRRPKYIIPFSVTKNVALVNIREQLLKGGFVPKEIKYFNPDLLRGIYVPYMLYDVRSKDRQLIRSDFSSPDSRHSSIKYYYREATAAFFEIPVDASSQFSNELSERLEPYRGNGMVEFKAEFLSGFYADLKDDDFTYLRQIARQRAGDMLTEQIQKTVPGQNHQVVSNRPYHVIEKEAYALFPVWFMIFHRNKETYTILVNGQTGKVVCALPADRRKIAIRFSLFSLLFSTLGFLFLPVMYAMESRMRGMAFALVFVGIPSLIAAGFNNLRNLKNSQKLTAGSRIKKFVTERQDS
ncbi:MAG: hypothetical protein HDR00_15590 [Lachnospiraceae bacterium]|nr:hypothetical protein [Lachnospiraceae bacterium]